MIRGALLDVDGTLIDSNNQHANAWVDAFREAGIEVDFREIRDRIGKGGDHIIPEVSGLKDDEGLGKKIVKSRDKIFIDKYLVETKAFPHTRDLLLAMKSKGLALIVASSSGKENLEKLLDRAEIKDVIDITTSSDDADKSKPSPDIIKAALRKSGFKPTECVMLGDTPYDIMAAHKAGVKTVAFTCGGWQKEDLKGAAAVYRDPEDLLGHLDSSPFFQK